MLTYNFDIDLLKVALSASQPGATSASTPVPVKASDKGRNVAHLALYGSLDVTSYQPYVPLALLVIICLIFALVLFAQTFAVTALKVLRENFFFGFRRAFVAVASAVITSIVTITLVALV